MSYLWVCIRIFFIADFNDGDKGRTGADKEGFPGGSVGKESACSAGDPGLGRRTPGVQFLGWEDPLEKEMATYSSILENSMDRGACWGTVQGITKSWT